VNEREKASFLGNASALLFPIDWPEPFGMVMIEAMACGTPVAAFSKGSVPEVIDDGVSGFLVKDVAEAASVLKRIGEFDRAQARRRFEQRFTIERVAHEYLSIYRGLPGVRRARRPRAAAASDTGGRFTSTGAPLSMLRGGRAEQGH